MDKQGVVRARFGEFEKAFNDTRQALRSLETRVGNRFNVSLAEVDHHDLWQRAGLTVAIVGREAGETQERLADIRRALHSDEAFQVVGEAHELVRAEAIPPDRIPRLIR